MSAPWMEELFLTLARAGWQGGVIGLIVLGVQFVFRKRLHPTWKYLLWAPVVLRLVLPVLPESGWSVFNLAPELVVVRPVEVEEGPQPTEPVRVVEISPGGDAALQSENMTLNPEGGAFPWLQVMGWLSAAGAVLVGFCFAAGTWRLSGRLRARGRAVGGETAELFEEMQSRFGLRQRVELIETEEVDSPALFGLWRPKLLLPPEVVERLSGAELRHIFAHECAHLKRRDLWTNAVLVGLQAVHWWNPLVWFFFRRMRADRELACDDLALSHLQGGAAKEYGQTLLRLLAGVEGRQRTPALVGILEEKSQLKERVRGIAGFRPKRGVSWLAVGLLGVLVVTGLSDAEQDNKKSAQQGAVEKTRQELSDRGGQDDNNLPVSKVPVFGGDVPVLGRLFRSIPGGGRNVEVVRETREKLERIIIPQISIPEELPLSKVAVLLRDLSRKNDPKGEGVQFSITSVGGVNEPREKMVAAQEFRVAIDPPLENVTLLRAIQEVVKQARLPLPMERPLQKVKYLVEEGWVDFVTQPEEGNLGVSEAGDGANADGPVLDAVSGRAARLRAESSQGEVIPPFKGTNSVSPAIRRLLEDGRYLMEMGKVEEAERKVREALKVEPNNQAALDYLSKIISARGQPYDPTRKTDREPQEPGDVLRIEVDATGRYLVEGKELTLEEIGNAINIGARENPRFGVSVVPDKNAPYSKVSALLKQVEGENRPATVQDAESKPGAKVEKDDLLLVEVTAEGGFVIEGKEVEEQAVEAVLRKQLEEAEGRQVYIRAERAAPYKAVVKLLDICQKLEVTNISFGTPPGSSEGNERELEGNLEKAEEKLRLGTFQVDPRKFETAIRKVIESKRQSGAKGRELSLQEAVRDFFELAGVNFGGSEMTAAGTTVSKAIFYNDRTGILFVRGSQKDLDLIKNALVTLSPRVPLVELQVRVGEIPGNGMARGIFTPEQNKLVENMLQAQGKPMEVLRPALTPSGRSMTMSTGKESAYPMGPIEITPVVGGDGYTIEISIKGTERSIPLRNAEKHAPDASENIPPRLKIYDGQTAVFSYPTTEEGGKVRFILVTPIVVDAAGNRVYGAEKVPFDRGRVPGQ